MNLLALLALLALGALGITTSTSLDIKVDADRGTAKARSINTWHTACIGKAFAVLFRNTLGRGFATGHGGQLGALYSARWAGRLAC